jgi:serine/threonine protein kinase
MLNSPIQAGLEPYPGYRLSRLLGRGGFSDVWQADVSGGQTLALKFMPCSENSAAPREIRSIQLVRQLHHRNLIGIERVWLFRSYIVIAMELADGGLNDLLEAYQTEYGSAIDREDVCRYLTQVASVLDFLNTRQHKIGDQLIAIQHCDVKPSNLLLCGETVKLSDFGLAAVTTGARNSHFRAGTTSYAAPEVFKGQLTDKTDQYSLAVTYCELRGGRLPFPEAPKTFQKNYEPPRPDLTMLSPKERPLIARALSTVPQNRWPSCSDLMARLSSLVREG